MTARRTTVPILLAALAAGCSGPAFDHPLPSSPLLDARWPAPFDPDAAAKAERGRDERSAADGGAEPAAGDVRGRMVAAARRWLGDAASRPGDGYGARDVDEILAGAMPDLAWDAGSGLAALVAIARDRGAYRSDDRPRPGDIALFHNQYDVNANGAFDDWLTGCAVVIEADGPRFVAVTRTGHAPREIVAWPDGPSVERLRGEKVNSYLRIPSRSDPKDAEYLACDLFAGYIDVEALEASAGSR
jgi:hypothetical protein